MNGEHAVSLCYWYAQLLAISECEMWAQIYKIVYNNDVGCEYVLPYVENYHKKREVPEFVIRFAIAFIRPHVIINGSKKEEDSLENLFYRADRIIKGKSYK